MKTKRPCPWFLSITSEIIIILSAISVLEFFNKSLGTPSGNEICQIKAKAKSDEDWFNSNDVCYNEMK